MVSSATLSAVMLTLSLGITVTTTAALATSGDEEEGGGGDLSYVSPDHEVQEIVSELEIPANDSKTSFVEKKKLKSKTCA